MLNWLHKARGVYLDAHSDGNSGGGSAAGDSSNGGTATLTIADPFEGIPFDELDDKTKASLKKAQAEFTTGLATLQTEQKKMGETVEGLKRQSGEFQSQRDILDRKLKAIIAGNGLDPDATPDEYLEKATEVLKSSGFTPEQVEKQAPIYANLLKAQLGVLKKELGRDISPFISSVVGQEAQSAFEQAQERDASGIMAVPEVAEKVWKQVQKFTEKGQPVNFELVLNLAKIQWVDYTEALRAEKKDVPVLTPRSVPTGGTMNTGFSFPGSSRSAVRPIASGNANDANQPKHALNEDTNAALAATFATVERETGITPKAFPKKAARK